MKLQEIDPNFQTGLLTREYRWHACGEGPLRYHGLTAGSGVPLCRMDPAAAAAVSEGVAALAYHTAGVSLDFVTDSLAVALRARLADPADMDHMPRSGSAGFDIYTDEDGLLQFRKAVMSAGGEDRLAGEYVCEGARCKRVRVHFPLYSGVAAVEIGLLPGAVLEENTAVPAAAPIVFYGSSITQGACASRPGNAYPNILSRMLGREIADLGFSGCARGEQAMAAYIAGLPMSLLVMDYDHNAPDEEELRRTHRPFFETIRRRQPDLPIVMISKPDVIWSRSWAPPRREIIRETWKQAWESGDRNVYFVDGETLFAGPCPDSCTVDGVHPNDLGFLRMAEHLAPLLARILGTGRLNGSGE